MKQASRRDFISDNSSSDDDLLPQISLRERLERKRAITSHPLLTNTNSGTFSQEQLATSQVQTEIHTENTNSDTYFGGLASNPVIQNEIHELGSERRQFPIVLDDNDDCSSQSSVPSRSTYRDETSDTEAISVPTNLKVKKKRTAEEIQENKKKAQEKKEERERIKMTKEAEKQMRKAERETKKQFSLGSCLKFITVLVDTHIINTGGFGVMIFKACEELGVQCQTQQLDTPFTIMWKRTLTECSRLDDVQVHTSQNEVIEGEILAIIPVNDFVHMVHTFKQEQLGCVTGGVSLKKYVQQLQLAHRHKNITTVVTGVEQYFKEMKSQAQKKHRDAVQSTNPNHIPKHGKDRSELVKVSRVDIEEALTDTFLHTNSNNYMVQSPEDLADLVRRFSKAVAEKPAKKDRFDAKFSFHEEGASGVKVDKNGVGLLKVWKQQLMQLKNVSQDVAQALVVEYPSPQLLVRAYSRCESEKEAIKLLENIVVRRGAGVLETSRRVGKELSRRLYTLFTQDDPDFVIK